MKNIKGNILLIAICLGAGFAVSNYLFPKYKVEKVEVEREVVKNNVVTVIKEVIKKDGTIEKETIINDQTSTSKNKENSLKVIENQWHAGIAVRSDSILFDEKSYAFTLQRRIIGDVFLGGGIELGKEVRYEISLGVSF